MYVQSLCVSMLILIGSAFAEDSITAPIASQDTAAAAVNQTSVGERDTVDTASSQALSPAASPVPDAGIFPAKTVLPAGVLFGTFTREDGPFLLDGNIIVPSGQILEFGPACTVYVGGEYSTITVFGQLLARGASDAPVVFMSAKKNPQPWDWDRIYCRSRNRSVFEHCIIRHSNYGISIENGSAGISNCRFDRNSLHGVVVRNGEAVITWSVFTGGHVSALNLLAGGIITADSLTIRDNLTAVTCAAKSRFKLNGGYLNSNVNGIITTDGAQIDIVAAEISRNKNGVVSTYPIPQKTREMVFANAVDVKVVFADEMEKLLKEPQPVASVVVPQSAATASLPEDFKAGFSAMNVPQEPTTSFIGNVTAGVTWYNPRSTAHPLDKDTAESYAQRPDGSTDTTRSISPTLRRQTKYPGEQSDDWYGGFQPELQFFANGRRNNADINLLMDLYSNQWLSTASYFGKNMFNLSMNYANQSVVIGDFFESASETSIPGRQMTGLRYSGKFLEMGRGEKRVEFKLAAGETEIAKDSGDHEIFVYNQTVDTGMSKRQQITYLAELNVRPTRLSTLTARGIISHDQTDEPLFRRPLTDPAALDPVAAQTGCIAGTVLLLDRKLELFGELDLGTADTLTDSSDEKIAWYNPGVEKAVPKVFSLFKADEFSDHFAMTAGARGNAFGGNANVKYLQVAPRYYSAGDPYMVSWRKNFFASVNKPVLGNLDLTGSYEFDRTMLRASGEGTAPSATDLNIFCVNSTYEMGEARPSFTLDYTLQHKKNDARESVVRVDTSYSEAFKDVELSTRISLEGKQNLENGISYSLRYQLLWDNDYGVHPDEQLTDVGDRVHNAISGWISFKVKRIIRNKTTVRVAFKHENRDSLRANQYKVSDQLTIQVIPRKLSCSVSGEYSYKSEKEFTEEDAWLSPYLTKYYAAEMEVKYSLTSRLTGSVKGRYEKSYDDIPGSSENYAVPITGLHLTYLF